MASFTRENPCYHLDATFDNSLGKGAAIRYDYMNLDDRRFFRDHGHIHPADFLRVVWAAGDSDPKIYDYVRQCALNSSAKPVEEE